MTVVQRAWSWAVFKVYGGRCQFCNGQASRIVLIDKNGEDRLENYTTSCAKCQVKLSKKVSLHPAFAARLKKRAKELKKEIERVQQRRNWEEADE